MNKLTKRITTIGLVALVLLAVSCGGKKSSITLTEKGKTIIEGKWKYDTNATIKDATTDLKDTSGVTADIELKDDVKAIGDFLTGTLSFYIDETNDKLAYERKYGKGILSISVVGYWEFNEDETIVIMKEWDSSAGATKPPVNYTIIELTADKLVMKEEGAGEHHYIKQ